MYISSALQLRVEVVVPVVPVVSVMRFEFL